MLYNVDYESYFTTGESQGQGFNSRMHGEIGLMSAVMHRSALDLLCDEPKLQVEAKQFFLDPSKEPYSYLWICEHLAINPQKLLKKLWAIGAL